MGLKRWVFKENNKKKRIKIIFSAFQSLGWRAGPAESWAQGIVVFHRALRNNLQNLLTEILNFLFLFYLCKMNVKRGQQQLQLWLLGKKLKSFSASFGIFLLYFIFLWISFELVSAVFTWFSLPGVKGWKDKAWEEISVHIPFLPFFSRPGSLR